MLSTTECMVLTYELNDRIVGSRVRSVLGFFFNDIRSINQYYVIKHVHMMSSFRAQLLVLGVRRCRYMYS